jgi:hypothetical protein
MSHDNWDYPNRGSSKCIHIVPRGLHICFQKDHLLRMWATSTHCGCALFTQHSVARKACFTREVVFSVHHGVILMLSANVDVRSASGSAFGLVMSGTLSWAPDLYLTGRLLSDIVLPRLLEVVTLGVRQHDAAPAHYGPDERQRLTRHIQDRWIGRRGPIT